MSSNRWPWARLFYRGTISKHAKKGHGQDKEKEESQGSGWRSTGEVDTLISSLLSKPLRFGYAVDWILHSVSLGSFNRPCFDRFSFLSWACVELIFYYHIQHDCAFAFLRISTLRVRMRAQNTLGRHTPVGEAK